MSVPSTKFLSVEGLRRLIAAYVQEKDTIKASISSSSEVANARIAEVSTALGTRIDQTNQNLQAASQRLDQANAEIAKKVNAPTQGNGTSGQVLVTDGNGTTTWQNNVSSVTVTPSVAQASGVKVASVKVNSNAPVDIYAPKAAPNPQSVSFVTNSGTKTYDGSVALSIDVADQASVSELSMQINTLRFAATETVQNIVLQPSAWQNAGDLYKATIERENVSFVELDYENASSSAALAKFAENNLAAARQGAEVVITSSSVPQIPIPLRVHLLPIARSDGGA